MPPETDRTPLNYSSSLREFLAASAGEPYPLAPWPASLAEGELDFLIDAIDAQGRRGVEMDGHLFSNILAVVIKLMAVETPAPSFSCSIGELDQHVFALGVCGALEQMRRAGVARILSPMVLTSDRTPAIELVEENA